MNQLNLLLLVNLFDRLFQLIQLNLFDRLNLWCRFDLSNLFGRLHLFGRLVLLILGNQFALLCLLNQ